MNMRLQRGEHTLHSSTQSHRRHQLTHLWQKVINFLSSAMTPDYACATLSLSLRPLQVFACGLRKGRGGGGGGVEGVQSGGRRGGGV